MTALITLLALAHFHLIGLAIVLCIGVFLAYLCVLAGMLPFIILAFICGRLAPFVQFEEIPNPDWKRKVDRWVIAGLIAFFPLLFGSAYVASLFGH
jgi:hypothetical protein